MEKLTTTTKLVAQTSETKIRMRAIRDVMVDNEIFKPGQEFETSEQHANELQKPIDGSYAFSGYRSDCDAPVHKLVRAERV